MKKLLKNTYFYSILRTLFLNKTFEIRDKRLFPFGAETLNYR